MSSTKRYWQDLGELGNTPGRADGGKEEFPQELAIDQVLSDEKFNGAHTGRRDFLKFLGFSIGAASLAACEAPVVKSIPYVNKPEDVTPGVANWYASSFYDGETFASIMVKTREGRPIHITGNPHFGITRNPVAKRGSINARVNSSVLGLYDGERLRGPLVRSENGLEGTAWTNVDAAIGQALTTASGRVVLLTNTVISPSAQAAISRLRERAPRLEHVQYDTISYSGITNANLRSFGRRIFPSYDLSRADVIVGVDADFLSNWGSSTENNWQYSVRRDPAGNMSKHFQFEARMSMTGANADERIGVRVSEIPDVIVSLHDHIARRTGGAPIGNTNPNIEKETLRVAQALMGARGRSVVLCGSNDEGVQTLVNAINSMLGSYGTVIDMDRPTNFFQGDDAAVAQLVRDMNGGGVGVLLIANCNPAYSLPNAEEFRTGIAKVGLSASFSTHADETASLCNYVCPTHHYLEAWEDHQPKPGIYAIGQPAIRPLFNTRQWQESLLRWAGVQDSYHSFMRDNWRNSIATQAGPFEDAWNLAVHNGVFEGAAPAGGGASFAGNVAQAAGSLRRTAPSEDGFELQFYTTEAIGDGQHANNPWLQELPDPLTKIAWDNYVLVSPVDADRLGLTMYFSEQTPADLVTLRMGERELTLPAVPAPGQMPGTLAIALGYGRGENGEYVGRAALYTTPNGERAPVGKNAYPFTSMVNGVVSYQVFNVGMEKAGGTWPVAITQPQFTHMDRHSVVKETTLAVFKAGDRNAYNAPHTLAVHDDVNQDGRVDSHDRKTVAEFDLWENHAVENVGHRWHMSIDLNACTGCGACVTACNSENNIPVVGKDEVRRSREMHWLRIDRYFSSDMTHEKGREEGKGKIERYLEMEKPSLNPKVVFQPMLCQHCNHAPCETVCPVAATTHSNEGLNQMAYNRCIGTRYCANNCPYKVRRFNWFNYVTEKFADVNPAWDDLGRMALNPDVVVRSRGVIEKCTFCVQRIQAGKLEAKKAGTPVRDGMIETACSAACGTGAIIFGDINDKGSLVRKNSNTDRSYYVIEEIGTKPNIAYQVKVRNTEEAQQA